MGAQESAPALPQLDEIPSNISGISRTDSAWAQTKQRDREDYGTPDIKISEVINPFKLPKTWANAKRRRDLTKDLVPYGEPFNKSGRLLDTMFELQLPETIYSAPMIAWLNQKHGSLFDFLVVELPLITALLLCYVAQISLATYLFIAVRDAEGDLMPKEESCNGDITYHGLRCIALHCFVSLVVKDVVETWEIHLWMQCFNTSTKHEQLLFQAYMRAHLPTSAAPAVQPVSGITRKERSVFYLVVLGKFLVAPLLLLAGSGAVLRSGNNFDLVLNTLAGVFVLEIDEYAYALMIPRALKKMTGGLPALNPNEAEGNWGMVRLTATAFYLYIIFAVCVLLDVAVWRGVWCADDGDGLVNSNHRALSERVASFFTEDFAGGDE